MVLSWSTLIPSPEVDQAQYSMHMLKTSEAILHQSQQVDCKHPNLITPESNASLKIQSIMHLTPRIKKTSLNTANCYFKQLTIRELKLKKNPLQEPRLLQINQVQITLLYSLMAAQRKTFRLKT